MNRSTIQRIIATTATSWMLAAGAQAQPPSNANWPFPKDESTAARGDRLLAQLGLDARAVSRLFEPGSLP